MTYSMIIDMEAYIEGELMDSNWYAALAAKAPTAFARDLLTIMGQDEYSHAKQLQDAYYVLTRQEYHPLLSPPVLPESYTECLKLRMLDEAADFKTYGTKYLEFQDAMLKNLFFSLCADVATHTSQLTLLLFETLPSTPCSCHPAKE